MKTIKKINLLGLLALLLFSISTKIVNAQGGCSNAGCNTTSLNISSGFNSNTQSLNVLNPIFPPVESNWQLISGPANLGMIFPAPSFNINPHPAWSSFIGQALWTSPFQSELYDANNEPGLADPFIFEKCFCLCEKDTITINLEFLFDDNAEISLDGVPLA